MSLNNELHFTFQRNKTEHAPLYQIPETVALLELEVCLSLTSYVFAFLLSYTESLGSLEYQHISYLLFLATII